MYNEQVNVKRIYQVSTQFQLCMIYRYIFDLWARTGWRDIQIFGSDQREGDPHNRLLSITTSVV